MLQRFFAIIRILSLDVVLGACVGNLFIAQYLQVKVPFIHLAALALCVWLIYTADHLADAYQVKHPAHSPRHLYHQQHFRTITTVFIIILLMDLVVIFNLSHKLIVWGLILSALVGFYFLLISMISGVKSNYKEFMIALLYAAGVFLSPVSLYHHPLSFDVFFVFTQFTTIALANLLIFALYEADLDEKDGHHSFVKSVGPGKATVFIYLCLIFVLVSALLCLFLYSDLKRLLAVELLFLIMTATLLLIMVIPSFFRHKERYRILGDAVFLFPVFILIY